MSARILFIATTLTGGGPTRAIEALAGALARDWRLCVCSLTTVAPDVASRLSGAGIDVRALGMRGRMDPMVMGRLLRLVREWRPALVHTHLSRADWLGRLVGRSRRTIVVSTIHNVHSRMYRAEFGPLMARLGPQIDRWTSPCVHRFVALSTGVERDLIGAGIPPGRVNVIPVGLDLSRRSEVQTRTAARRALGLGDRERVVITTALLKAQKAIGDLIEAVGLLSRRGCRVSFVVFGDGPERRALERRIAQLPAGPAALRLAGWVEDAMRLLPAADLFVLPSHWEGLPVSLLEAMSLGIPAIGTRVSGTEDVIEDGTTGWLVDPGQPMRLADRIASVLGNESDRCRVGQAGRAVVEGRFSAEVAASAHTRMYDSLLKAAGVSAP